MNAFPSLVIRADSLVPQGAFAEAQAAFLRPDPTAVADLERLLAEKKAGIVAHFYMDPELQGVITAAKWPHLFIADSLAMSDKAVEMARGGAEHIIVLGVDFMSENVRAVLDNAGFSHIPVYRVDQREIGCSLAEAAASLSYAAWLKKAAQTDRSLHVIYINTGLDDKARAQSILPTITCTSSNVVQTILQASAQIPDLHIWYGPDTYMGENLRSLLERLASLSEEEIAALHPGHSQRTIRDLLARFDYYKQGNCIVHHLFGADVVETVRREYADCYHTAHLEVPGEMFALAAEAAQRGRGVVGSTSNILDFIRDRLADQLQHAGPARLRFVLGTEAGMITAIVDKVQKLLQASGRDDVEVEIIFPVASEAVAAAPGSELAVVPGVSGGEGCSTAGGCATCPYMKMNSLDSLFDVLEAIGERDLSAHKPRTYDKPIAGRAAADLGSEPILFMRHFQRHGHLPPDLVRSVAGGPAEAQA